MEREIAPRRSNRRGLTARQLKYPTEGETRTTGRLEEGLISTTRLKGILYSALRRHPASDK